MAKNDKRSLIGQFIDLASGRFHGYEYDTFEDLIRNRDKYNGKSETYKKRFTDWSSDGKYERTEERTFTFISDEEGLGIREDYSYHDDDGASGSSSKVYRTGREILRFLDKIFK